VEKLRPSPGPATPNKPSPSGSVAGQISLRA